MKTIYEVYSVSGGIHPVLTYAYESVVLCDCHKFIADQPKGERFIILTVLS